MLDVSIESKRITLVNIYGPNKDSPIFFKTVVENAQFFENNHYIFCGDFNFVINPNIDCRFYKDNNINNPNARNTMLEAMDDLDIIDVYRELHPDRRRYTWRRKNPTKLARLDFFLISNLLLYSVHDCVVEPGYRSDHSMVILSLKFQDFQKGKSLWKFNNSMLYDKEYVQKIKQTILQIKKQYMIPVYDINNIGCISDNDINFVIDDQLFLEVLMMEIRGKSISHSAYIQKCKNHREKELGDLIKNLEENEELTEESDISLDDAKKQLEVLRMDKLKGAMVRSKAKWVDEGEKPTKYFCNLEKRNFTNKIIQRVEKDNGKVITTQHEILEEICKYYEYLYENKTLLGNREWEKDELFENVPKLTLEENINLEGEITYQEATNTIKKMKNNTSPGSDGFTTEFYKFFWKDLGIFVIRALNCGFKKGELSSTQKQGIITCLPKPDKPKQFLKNWRPITLLNTVYKIGSGCIAGRIKSVLPKLISGDQTGFISGRNISENTRLIYDIMNYTQIKNIPGMILLIDFEKAFDTVSWDYLRRVLKFFNFGESIIKWVMVFYQNIITTINQGGNLSRWFNNGRGCRQGDPISPYLFLLCVEILAIKLKGNEKIKGIKVGNIIHLISQFADDTSLFLDGSKTSLEATLEDLKDFKDMSGLTVNYSKSQVVWIGSKRYSVERLVDDKELVWGNDRFKVLGIEFDVNLDEILKINFDKKIIAIKNLLKHWERRNLTPIGRITVIKSLAISKLVHLFISLPNPSKDIIEKLNKILFNFLWKSPVAKVKKSVVTQEYEKGGLNMINIENFIAYLKMSWVKKLIFDAAKWQSIIGTEVDISNVIKFGPVYALQKLEKSKNMFWKDVMKSWKRLICCFEKSNYDKVIANSVLWYNENIKVNRKTLYLKVWCENKIYTVNSLLDEDGKIIDYNQFKKQYKVKTNFLEFFGVRQALKKLMNVYGIKQFVKTQEPIIPLHIAPFIYNRKNKKKLYQIFNSSEEKPTGQKRWDKQFVISHEEWSRINKNAFYITKDTKLQWLQYRINHKILATNSLLSKMKVINNDLCTFCAKEKETIEHVLYDCKNVTLFFNNVQSWFMDNFSLRIVVDKKTFLLGCSDIEMINLINYHIKHFIYCCKCRGKPLMLNNFVATWTNVYKVERHLAYKNNYVEKFERKWTVFHKLRDPLT